MSVLSDARIIEKVYDEALKIEPFIYEHIQPASIDLTLGKKIKRPKKDIKFGVNVFDSQKEIYDEIEIGDYELKSGEFIVASICERIELPADLCGFVKNRSSLARSGIDVGMANYVNPGYKGVLTIAVKNVNTIPIKIHAGMRICQLVFEDVEPEARTDYGKKSDAKYQEEKGSGLSKLELESEFIEYLSGNTNGKDISEFLFERIERKDRSTKELLSKREKIKLGLK